MWSVVRIIGAAAFLLSVSVGAHARNAGGGGPGQFFDAPWLSFDVGDDVKPQTVAFGDIDGDGDRDALVAHSHFSDPGISILRSNGDGTFAPEERYDLRGEVGDAVLADFDGDGDLDAIATIFGNAGLDFRVGILRNDGNGNFSAPVYEMTGEGPVGLIAADFTSDGFIDIVTANFGYLGRESSVGILKHNGQTGKAADYLSVVTFPSGEDTQRIDAADFDGDGDLDLAVGRGDFAHSGDHGVSILFNDGAGNFERLTEYGELQNAYRTSPAIHLVDIDNDGDTDVLSGGARNGAIYSTLIGLRLNDGEGGFDQVQVIEGPENRSYTPYYISTSDLNEDGWPDVITSVGNGRDDDGFLVFPSNGSGDFMPAEFHRAAKWTKDVVPEDVDGDGDDDIVTVASFSAVITVHENRGAGAFLMPPTFPVTYIARDMKAADLDLDGDLDLLVVGFELFGDGVVAAMWNDGEGVFTREVISDIRAGYVELADLNGNGCIDVVLAPYRNEGFGFWVGLNNCEDAIGPFIPNGAGGGVAAGLGVFDVDNDGDPDIVLPDSGQQNDLHLLRNEGDGMTFTLLGAVPDTVSGAGIAGADLNHDGNVDLVTSNYGGQTVLLGNGDFTFSAPNATGIYLGSAILADIGGDGHHDLCGFIASDFTFTAELATAAGFGDGQFEFPSRYPAATDLEFYVDEIVAHDVNGDLLTDLIVSNGPSSDVSVFLSNGDGTLRQHDGHRYGIGYNASSAVPADFNGDGILDLAALVNYGDLRVIFGVDPGTNRHPAEFTDFEILLGTLVSGGLPEINLSDDQVMRIRSQYGFSAVEANVLELVLGATTNVASAALIDVSIEARLDHPDGTVKVRLRNWVSDDFEEIHRYALGMQEIVEHAPPADAAQRIRAGDGRIELSIHKSVIATFSVAGFQTFIDHVEVVVEE